MRLIFHGDDLGLTQGVNEAIMRGFEDGLLTSASIIASGEAAREAMAWARGAPGLDLGVHLTLCDERPLLPAGRIPSLISSGDRLPSRAELIKRVFSGRIDYREVAAEWRAQVETLLNGGVPLSHLDSHQFVHLFPGLLPVCLTIIERYRIPFARGAVVDPPSLQAGLRRLAQWTGIALWSRLHASRLLARACRVIPSVGFLLAGGRLNRTFLLDRVARLEERGGCETVEVILHPGTGDAHTESLYGHWDYDWKRDLDLVLDRALRDELAERGIETTSFREAV